MSSSKVIKGKIKTVGSIKKMTRAMEMIARTKMKKNIDNALSARPYAVYARELLVNLTRKERISHELLNMGKGEKNLVVLVASDRGLCGGYNTNILRKYHSVLNEGNHTDLIVIGRRAENMARKTGKKVLYAVTPLGDSITTDIADQISTKVTEAFLSGEYKKVVAIYTNFISSLKQVTTVKTILPISAETLEETIVRAGDEDGGINIAETTRNLSLYTLEPNAEEVLGAFVPHLVTTEILQVLLEAKASEESMRMFAMKNATDSAGKLQDKLTISFNKARQAGITREIAEISSGADALQM
ncbi:MAG: ATP synthase F1 subunit gamma [Candidatus Zambryskibacteria bacterium CG10_big_fil_rev_8_21_14_0_10_42_12]|uniref:ATP synthase gamma chain n=1 Tax=Candidatus Zambryskibacteria bacterium CG10_big_fil_rev_8_21_14_0_10_42_12 TaxID=1975115 RepID=A0A2H0QVT2_9BACT|nr:MAG: ATP synthase F1 subunit gamma [Candidatus Zambryskibacteria bacterium CG10_big_fil_rev_8_21_14_0_10_42_12]